MKPINKYIVISPIVEEIVAESGLMMTGADASDFRYKKATIVKKGTEVSCVKEGDEIYYDKNAGYSLFIEDKPYTIIQERDVVIVI